MAFVASWPHHNPRFAALVLLCPSASVGISTYPIESQSSERPKNQVSVLRPRGFQPLKAKSQSAVENNRQRTARLFDGRERVLVVIRTPVPTIRQQEAPAPRVFEPILDGAREAHDRERPLLHHCRPTANSQKPPPKNKGGHTFARPPGGRKREFITSGATPSPAPKGRVRRGPNGLVSFLGRRSTGPEHPDPTPIGQVNIDSTLFNASGRPFLNSARDSGLRRTASITAGSIAVLVRSMRNPCPSSAASRSAM